MNENDIAREVVDVAYRVHVGLGPGLFESVYAVVVASELVKRGLNVASQVAIPVVYEGTHFEIGFRADLVVADKVIVEIKSLAKLGDVHKKQLLTYLRLSDKRLGLLINFNEALIKDGITRIVNRMED
ncbi:MAG TPA: GxxExxY protein [Bryobacteraceae bacterium]|nr:GxxExxY protein [Bryobacteraceae bacterium]